MNRAFFFPNGEGGKGKKKKKKSHEYKQKECTHAEMLEHRSLHKEKARAFTVS